MSEFCCANGHPMGSEERRKNQCAICGKPVFTMDGMTARQIANMEAREAMRVGTEYPYQEDVYG